MQLTLIFTEENSTKLCRQILKNIIKENKHRYPKKDRGNREENKVWVCVCVGVGVCVLKE